MLAYLGLVGFDANLSEFRLDCHGPQIPVFQEDQNNLEALFAGTQTFENFAAVQGIVRRGI